MNGGPSVIRQSVIVRRCDCMNLKPLRGKVLIRIDLEPEKTAGGLLYVPDTARQQKVEGVVLAVGLGRILDNGVVIEPSVKVGDRVVVGRYGGQEIKSGTFESTEGVLKVVDEEREILCVLEDEPEDKKGKEK